MDATEAKGASSPGSARRPQATATLAPALGESWQGDFDLEDGSIVNGKEQTTKFTGQRRMEVDGNFFLLASFTRRSREEAKREVTGFGKIPMVGSAFRKSTAQRANRSFMILARAVQQRPGKRLVVPNFP